MSACSGGAGPAHSAVLEVQLTDGSSWATTVVGYDGLCDRLATVPVPVERVG